MSNFMLKLALRVPGVRKIVSMIKKDKELKQEIDNCTDHLLSCTIPEYKRKRITNKLRNIMRVIHADK